MRLFDKIKNQVKLTGIKGTTIRCWGTLNPFFSEDAILTRYVKRNFSDVMLDDTARIGCIATNDSLQKQDYYPIFVCWFQGIENAPDIVKLCYKNLCKQQDHVILITEDNYEEYVKLPEYVLEKYKKGYMGKPHFSDLLRTALILLYGGVWIDSTMLLTSPIPDYIFEQEIFVFTRRPNDCKYQVASSQFIFAKKGNKILNRTLIGMLYYWKKHNKLISYYLYHYMFAVSVKLTDDTWEMFETMPWRLGAENHLLQWRSAVKYNELEWNEMCKTTFAHKMTYKSTNPEIYKEGTYYTTICRMYG